MKIAINKCYGGFGVSTEALKKLIALNSKTVEVHKEDEYFVGSRKEEAYGKAVDAGDGYLKDGFVNVLYKDGKIYSFNAAEEYRSDPALIQVIEEMGDAANEKWSKIKIIEIPDGTSYEISDYDGMERVEERHQAWG